MIVYHYISGCPRANIYVWFALTDRNMQTRLFLRVSLEFWDVEISGIITSIYEIIIACSAQNIQISGYNNHHSCIILSISANWSINVFLWTPCMWFFVYFLYSILLSNFFNCWDDSSSFDRRLAFVVWSIWNSSGNELPFLGLFLWISLLLYCKPTYLQNHSF